MAKRKTIGKKLRFEVFKRDSFTCQYCGVKAPDVVLVLDHVNPVSAGGDNDMMNLVTSCDECNSGKGARKLGDESEIEKQRRQLEALQERREQIDMMLAWKRGLIDINEQTIIELREIWEKLCHYQVNEHGVQGIRKLLHSSNAAEITDAMTAAAAHYLKFENGETVPTLESANKAFGLIGGILRTNREQVKRPWLHDLYKLRAAVRKNKSGEFINWVAIDLLETAFRRGADVAELWRVVYDSRTFSQWRYAMQEFNNELGGNADA